MTKVEHSKISATQFMFAIVCFIRSSSLLSALFASITNQDSWIVVIFGMIVCLPVIWVYVSLAKAFPRLNLIQINNQVFGRIVGKVISALYIWFFFTLTALNLRDLGGFVNRAIMTRTPQIVIIIIFILLCAWAVYYGLEVVTRYSIYFIAISTTILVTSIFSITLNIDFKNFLPIFDQPIYSYIQGTHILSVIPFGELVVFLMVTPYVDIKAIKLSRYFFGGFLIGGSLILLVILRDIAVLGNVIKYLSLPSFETFRLATLFKSVSHMEILFSVLLIILLYFKISFLFYVSLLAVSHFFHIKTYRPLILPSAAIIVTYSILIFENRMQHIMISRETAPFFWPLFEMILPFITLIAAYIKKAAKKDKADNKEAPAA